MTEKRGKPGNPNPSPATRFQKGSNGNPKGKTSEQKKLEMNTAVAALRNAEAAIRIRERVLRAAEARLNELSSEEVLAEYVEAAMLKLLTDSETRGLGAPQQAVDVTTNGESVNSTAALDRLIDRINAIAERSGKTGEPASE